MHKLSHDNAKQRKMDAKVLNNGNKYSNETNDSPKADELYLFHESIKHSPKVSKYNSQSILLFNIGYIMQLKTPQNISHSNIESMRTSNGKRLHKKLPPSKFNNLIENNDNLILFNDRDCEGNANKPNMVL